MRKFKKNNMLIQDSQQSHKSRAKKTSKDEMDEVNGLFVVIRHVSDRQGNIPIKGIEERMRVDRNCIYCDYFEDPVFNDPEYPKGGGYCSVKNGPTRFDDCCDRFKPDDRSSWWLQGEYMSGRYPSVSVWWKTYSDEKRQEKEKKQRQEKELLPVGVSRIDVEIDRLSSFEKPNLSDICLSPDGKYMTGQYTSKEYSEDYKIGLWDIQAKKQLLEIPLQEEYRNFCFSPSGKFLAGNQSYRIVSIWDLQIGKQVNSADMGAGLPLRCLIFTADERYLVVGHGSCLETWDIQRNIVSKERKTLQGEIYCLSVSADGKYLAAGTEDHIIYIFDTDKWEELNILRHHETSVKQVDFHPQSQLLVSVSRDKFETEENGKMKLWNIQLAKELREFPCHGQGCFDATGKLLAGNGDEGLDVWDISTGAKIRTLPMEQESEFCFSSKADILAMNKFAYEELGKVKIFRIKMKQL